MSAPTERRTLAASGTTSFPAPSPATTATFLGTALKGYIPGRMPSVIPRIQAALAPTLGFLLDPEFERLLDDPSVANFALGNPQELPLAELVSSLQQALEPKDK